MREIEVKLKANDLVQLKEKLSTMGCELSDPINQHDVIYSKAGSIQEWEESKAGHIVMRIRRQSGKDAEFNLKQQMTTELDNTEYESRVSDPEAMHQILKLIGYEPQVEVKKVRQKGKFKDYEICLDEVERLGSFVELEKLTDETVDPDNVREELFQTLESLGLSRSDEESMGYDTQIFHLDHK